MAHKYRDLRNQILTAESLEEKRALALQLTDMFPEKKAIGHRELINKQTDPTGIDKVVGMIIRVLD